MSTVRAPHRRASGPAVIATALLVATSLAGCSGSEQELAEPTTSAASTTSTADETTSEKTTTSETTTANATKGPICDAAELRKDNPEWAEWEIFECEGGFARYGIPNSDAVGYMQWNGTEWEKLEGDGSQYSEMYGADAPCFTAGYLDKLGVPSSIREKMTKCSGQTSPSQQATQTNGSSGGYYFQNGIIMSAGLGEAGEDASFPACDGRNILILDSVIDHGNDGGAMYDIAQQVLIQHPSGRPVRFTVPGQCPSLRAQVDGNNIYPVYIDFGSDVSAMCQAKATYGGNGRVLYNRAEYVDPC